MSQYKLLTVGGNPKIAKSDKAGKGYYTALLHLSPYKTSGYNTCRAASAKSCGIVCLNGAGRGRTHVVQNARKRKTKLLFENKPRFVRELYEDIKKFVARCKRLNLKPAIRLNGTSDLDWNTLIPTLMTDFPEVQWYDYCKIKSRMRRYLEGKLPKNYHLTFSRHEKNEFYCDEVLRKGGNVAIVFSDIPNSYRGYKCINGDTHDLRFLDPKNVVVGLTPKGPAKHDTTGFVIRKKHVTLKN